MENPSDPGSPMDPSTPPLDPNAGLPADIDLTGKKGSKVPLMVVGAVVLGGIGFVAFKAMKEQDERKAHAAFMESFAEVEKEELGKFWACVLGPNVDPGMFKDNLALGQRIEGAFSMDLKGYPAKVREECTPKAVDAKHKVEALVPPGGVGYEEPLQKYGKTLDELAHQFDEWAKVAPQQLKDRQMGQKVQVTGTAWHSFEGGKPSNEVVAYDRFLHCAVPGIDKMKDGQAVVEYLFKECKRPAYIERVEQECGKEVIEETPGAATSGFKSVMAKLQGDDREMQAFDDCLRKGRKSARKDDLEGIGKAWVAYMEAGSEVRKIGQEALKE